MIFKFASWNVHGARATEGGWILWPQLCDADFVAFQELEFRGGRDDALAAESEALVRSTGLPHFAGFPTSASQFDQTRQFGVGVASRFPIVSTRRALLPNPMQSAVRRGRLLWSHDKGALECVVNSRGVTLRLIAVHLIPFHMFDGHPADSIYAGIWRSLVDFVVAVDGQWLMGGDFNAEDRSLMLDGLPGARAVFDGVSTRPDSTLSHDDVLYSFGLEVLSQSVCATSSDHHLISATLRSFVN